jgi:DNA-binding transcriptional LysR family regulator
LHYEQERSAGGRIGLSKMLTRAIDFIDDDALTGLSLRNLRALAVIAAEGSLTAAASRLSLSQGAVSAQLAAAEAVLGVSLFTRHGRGVVTTEAGRAVVQRIGTLFNVFDEIRSDARGKYLPTVTIGAVEPTAVTRIIPFIKRSEARLTDVRLALRIATPYELVRLVESGELDFAITPIRTQTSRAATFRPLYKQELVLLVPDGHHLASKRSASLLELVNEQLIVGEETCTYRRLIAQMLRAADVDVAIRARFGSINTLVHAVKSDLGVAILPRELVEPNPPGTVIVPLRDPMHLPIGLFLRRDAQEMSRRVADELANALDSNAAKATRQKKRAQPTATIAV